LQNEDILKKCVADYQSKLKQMDERFQQLKKQAEDKLNEFVRELLHIHLFTCRFLFTHDLRTRLICLSDVTVYVIVTALFSFCAVLLY